MYNLDALYYAHRRVHDGSFQFLWYLFFLTISVFILVCEKLKPGSTTKRFRSLVILETIFVFFIMIHILQTFYAGYSNFSQLIWIITQIGFNCVPFLFLLWCCFSLSSDLKSNKKSKILIITQLCLSVIFCFMPILTDNLVIILLTSDMGDLISIPRTMYKIRHLKPRTRKATDLLLEDLLCNRIPIDGNNRMTPSASRLFEEEWVRTFGKPLTPTKYQKTLGKKICPIRSEANGKVYPRMNTAHN